MTAIDTYVKITGAFYDYDESLVKELIIEALNQGEDPLELLKHLSGILEDMGEQYSRMEIFLPELMIAGDIMEAVSGILKYELLKNKEDVPIIAKMILGAVKSDVHDIGKNIVKTMFTASGFEVIDLGVDVPAEKFAEEAKRIKPEFIGLSTTMSATMSYAKETVEYIESIGIRDQVKILIGGGSMTEDIAKRYGADGYGADASEAVKVAKRFLENHV